VIERIFEGIFIVMFSDTSQSANIIVDPAKVETCWLPQPGLKAAGLSTLSHISVPPSWSLNMSNDKADKTNLQTQQKKNLGILRRILSSSQNLLLPVVIILLTAWGWFLVVYQTEKVISAATIAYQETQLEITRSVARGVESYLKYQLEAHGQVDVVEFEQEVFEQFIAPVRLLEQGDAWIYAPDHVVFDRSSDFPDQYRDKNMAEIFALQAEYGAYHYEEMTEAVMNAREGVGWYVWLPEKGREIVAWTPVSGGEFVWIIGLSTPLPEILKSTGIQGQIYLSFISMGLVTIAILGLLFIWDSKRRQNERAEVAREQSLLIEQEQRLLAETLGQAFLVLTTKTEQVEVLDEILIQVHHVTPYDAANVMLIKGGVLHLVRWRGYQPTGSEEILANLKQSIFDFSLDAEVIQQRQPLVIPDVWLEPRWVVTSTSAWIRSFIAMPLCSKSGVIGLLRLDSRTPGKFSQQDLERIRPLANAAVVALENAQLYDQLRQELNERKKAELAALELNRKFFTVQYVAATIASSLDLRYILDTVTSEIVNLVKAEGCFISEWERTTDTVSIIAVSGLIDSWVQDAQDYSYQLTRFPLKHSVLVERQVHQVTLDKLDDNITGLVFLPANQIKTLLMLPMEVQNDVIGLVELVDRRSERQFTFEEIALVQMVINQAAIAIKNARLYAEIDKRLKAQIALQKAIVDIASTLDLTTVLSHIARELGQAVDATSTYICSYEPETMTSTVLAEYFGPRATETERVSDLGATYPLPRDFSKNFELLLAGELELIHLNDLYLSGFMQSHMQQYGAQTILNIPLVVKGQIMAFAELWESQHRREFTLEEMNLSQSIAQQAAVALENAQLYNKALKEITERQKVEQVLRESEMKFRTLAETTAAAIFIYQGDQNCYVNPAGVAITGYSEEELLTMNFWDIIHPDFRPLVKERGQARQQGEAVPPRYELKILTKNKMERWLDVTLGVIEFDGAPAILGTAFDITNRKESEEALRKSEANLKAILDSSHQAFVLIDPDYKIRAFNKVAVQGIELIFGKALKEGYSICEFVLEEDLEDFNRKFDKALAGERVSSEKNLQIDQTDVWVEFNYNPVFAESAEIMGVCFSTTSIDERKKMIETLAESEDRLLAEIQSTLEITRALVTETNLNKLLEFMMIQAKYLTQATGAAALLLSDDGQQLEVIRAGDLRLPGPVPSDEPGLHLEEQLKIPLKGSLAELALKFQMIQISNQAMVDEQTASLRASLQPQQMNSVVCAPLVILGKKLGVLLIWSEEENFFIERDSRMIALFADQAALALNNAQLYALSHRLSVEQERQRLARDLHDSVAQSLYSVGMAAETCLRLLNQRGKAGLREPVTHIHELSQVALREIRERVHQLYPTTLIEKSLKENLEIYCQNLRRQHGLNINLVINSALRLSLYQEENIYYILKEALWNVVKHAAETTVEVKLVKAGDQIILSVIDQGPGFKKETIVMEEMFGLRSMKERANLLGGSFEIHSQPGSGTQIIVQIPIA
jgi:PAS domain S-box-containing protein